VKAHSVGHAHWYPHVNGVNATRDMREWLTDTMSLTMKLMARSEHFRVRRLRQERGMCLSDEAAVVELPRRSHVQEREVLLQCDGRPVVFAHTIVPLNATTSDWPFFGTLGERSLGTTLFGDPRVIRGKLQYARLRPQHPLVERARAALDGTEFSAPVFARRCLYRRRNGVLLVTELFLPAIAELKAPRTQLNLADRLGNR
jgi:chorismate lyase